MKPVSQPCHWLGVPKCVCARAARSLPGSLAVVQPARTGWFGHSWQLAVFFSRSANFAANRTRPHTGIVVDAARSLADRVSAEHRVLRRPDTNGLQRTRPGRQQMSRGRAKIAANAAWIARGRMRVVQLDWTSCADTQTKLPRDQEGYGGFEYTDEKLSTRRIHWCG